MQDLQTPFAAAIVMPTILRPSLERAVRSVFDQDLDGRIQLLIGVDAALGDAALLDRLELECPDHVAMTVFAPGYSTSVRHGGLYPNRFSGALRTILTYLANARHVAYLDDDNWWAADHLSSLKSAMGEDAWAWSQRWFVEAEMDEPICIDEWESVGPGAGIFLDKFGGFVDPSSLMIDKLACHEILPYWAMSPFEDGTGEDRLIFAGLTRIAPGQASGAATSYYRIEPADAMHLSRLQQMRERGVVLPSARRAGVRSLRSVLSSVPPPTVPARAPMQPAPPPMLVAEVLKRLKPGEILVLADGDGAIASSLAVEAGEGAVLAVTDHWNAAEYQTATARIAAAGLADRVVALPPTLGDGVSWLAQYALALDLVHLARPVEAAVSAELCRSVWPMLREGGILLGTGSLEADRVQRAAIESFAAETGAALLPMDLDESHYWLLEKR